MRALTVRQPWAWAIVHGGKDVENRTRNVAGSYRGPVAIHAGLGTGDQGFEFQPLVAGLKARRDRGEAGRLPRGAFVGVVDLVDVHQADWCWEPEGLCSPWAQSSAHHLVLANPRPLEVPIPARGMLGLWTPPPAVLEQLQAVTA